MTIGLDILAAWLMFGALVVALLVVVLRDTGDDPLAEARRADERSVADADDVP